MSEQRAVILLSGGLDSATVVAMAQAQGFRCYTMSFDYGQRHRAELQAAQQIAEQLGVIEHKVIGLDLNGIGGSALTDSSIAVPETPVEGIPVTYVPARNTVFLALALGWAEVLGARDIFIGGGSPVQKTAHQDTSEDSRRRVDDLGNSLVDDLMVQSKAFVPSTQSKNHLTYFRESTDSISVATNSGSSCTIQWVAPGTRVNVMLGTNTSRPSSRVTGNATSPSPQMTCVGTPTVTNSGGKLTPNTGESGAVGGRKGEAR